MALITAHLNARVILVVTVLSILPLGPSQYLLVDNSTMSNKFNKTQYLISNIDKL